MRPLAACGLVLLIAAAACEGLSRHGAGRSAFVSASAPSVSALAVVEIRTPTLQVPRYDTSGTYPQVTGGSLDLQSVNAALRAAVVSDQSRYARYARREKPRTAPSERGVYRTTVDRRYLSASTVVVSALLPLTRELSPGQHEGDGWLAMTVGVRSGGRVAISDLFANPGRGLRVLAEAWKAEIRHTGGRSCLRIYPGQYRATSANYRNFALTPGGLAVGSWEIAACYRLVATVPYRLLLPYLSKLGSRLVAGVRAPPSIAGGNVLGGRPPINLPGQDSTTMATVLPSARCA